MTVNTRKFLIDTIGSMTNKEIQKIGQAGLTILEGSTGKEDIKFEEICQNVSGKWTASGLIDYINTVYDKCNDMAIHDMNMFFYTAITMVINER